MLNYEYPPLGGGAAPITQALTESLAAAGHHVDVVTMHYRGLPLYEEARNMTVQRVLCLRSSKVRAITVEMLSYVCAALVKCAVLTHRHQYDIIHAHFIIPTGLVAVPLKLLRGIPVLITIHGSDVPGYNPDRFKRGHRVLAPLWYWLVHHTDTIVSPSRYLADLLHRADPARVDIIPHGFTPHPYTARPRERCILAASRLFHRKGMHLLINALAQLDRTGWRVIIAGDGPELEHLKAQAQQQQVPVEFPGFLGRDQLQALYESSMIFVFPSMRENFPVVLLEALSAGCAVITTNVSGMPEVLGDAGMQVPPNDVAALRDALHRLMTDDSLRERLQAQSSERIKQFAWERIREQYVAAYTLLVKNSPVATT